MKFIREMWSWSMRVILMTALGGKRGLILYLNLIVRWRRWWHPNDAVQSHWNITPEQFKDVDTKAFNEAFADAVAKRWGEDMRAQMRGEFDEF